MKKNNEINNNKGDESQTENLLRIIVEKAPIGIYVVNLNGEIEMTNPKFGEISGVKSHRGLLGTNVLELPSYKESGLDNLIKKGLKGDPFEATLRHRSYIGQKETWRRYVGVPIQNKQKKTEKLLLMMEDITALKQKEELINELESKLQVKP